VVISIFVVGSVVIVGMGSVVGIVVSSVLLVVVVPSVVVVVVGGGKSIGTSGIVS